MFDNKNFALIKANRLFAGTAPKLKISISSKELLTISEGSTIYEKNESADAVYLVISGEVKLEIPGIFSKPIIVTKSKDDFFGELEYLDNSPRRGNATAATDCFLCVLNREKIQKLTEKDFQVLNNLLREEPEEGGSFEDFSFDEDSIFDSFNNDKAEKDQSDDVTLEDLDIDSITSPEGSAGENEIPQIDFYIPDIEDLLRDDYEIKPDDEESKTLKPDIEKDDLIIDDFEADINLLKTLDEFDEPETGDETTDDAELDYIPESINMDEHGISDIPLESSFYDEDLDDEDTELLDFEPISGDFELPPESEDIKIESPGTDQEEISTEKIIPEETPSEETEAPSEPETRTHREVEVPEDDEEIIKADEESEELNDILEPVDIIDSDTFTPEDIITLDDLADLEVPGEDLINAATQLLPELEEEEVSGEKDPGEAVESEEKQDNKSVKVKDEKDSAEPVEISGDRVTGLTEDLITEGEDLLDSLMESTPDTKEEQKQQQPEIIPPDSDNKEAAGSDKSDVNINLDNTEEVDEMTAAQFKRLIEASQKISSGIKLDETLDSIIDAAKNLTEAERGLLFIVDRDTNELWSKTVNGEPGNDVRLKIGEEIAGEAAEKNIIINIPNAQKDSRFNKQKDKLEGLKTKSLLCFPVTNKSGYVTAVLQLSNSAKGEFNASDEEALSALSLNISLALENAELVEKQLQNDRLSSLGKMANFLIQDIKKPVLTIKYYAEHIKKKEVSNDVVQIVNMLIDQSNAVVDLVQTTLSYSEGKGILRAQPLRLSTVLNEIFALLAEYVESRNVKLFKKYESDAVVNIDKREFYQACFQVVKNACDAMPGGGDIYVLARIDKERVIIEFKDSGLGVPESIKGKIFEPFMSHGKKQGVGLGLSIAEKIVKDHGGTITFESETGEGTTFLISLPFISTV